MAEIPSLVKDLALILVTAGIVTLLFKKLKQPLVLGYIMAGFIVSPNLPLTMSVVDHENIETWANIGVMFLLFTLGLDFSFKKILKMGMAPIIAALVIVFCMMLTGNAVASMFGWSEMNGLFLAGMLAMSSTTIIYKAFDDLGLKQQQFASLVMSVLILEDILAIVMMVLLGAIAKGGSADGEQMLGSVLSIGFFIVLWFVVGLFLIPTLLRSVRKLMNEEVLLIVSLGLCCMMAVISTMVGFSSAFGAFVMGSILAETVEAHKIEKVVKPVKDLFGAIFFVSVGMLVDVNIIAAQWLPIVVITLAIIIGQSVFGTFGYMLAGQPLKNAMRCGFSMAQIGEFAFIIASLGLSLGVISDFIYPVVVAVSVITTFLTPYMMRGAVPAYQALERVIPDKLMHHLNKIADKSQAPNDGNNSLWRPMLTQMLVNTLIYGTVSIAIVAVMNTIVRPMLAGIMPVFWAGIVYCVATILLVSPFLRAMVMKKNRSQEFRQLWANNARNRGPLIFTIVIRAVLAVMLVCYVLRVVINLPDAVMMLIALVLLYLMVISRALKTSSILLERRFVQNLRSKDYAERAAGKRRPLFADKLLDRDIHIASVEVPQDSLWAGKTLRDLNLAHRFGVQVSSIIRGHQRINIPSGTDVLFPGDQLNVIGNDAQFAVLNSAVNEEVYAEQVDFEKHDMKLYRFVLKQVSAIVGKTLVSSGLRNEYNCMLVGMEKGEENLSFVAPDYEFQKGDILWVVGEQDDIKRLQTIM